MRNIFSSKRFWLVISGILVSLIAVEVLYRFIDGAPPELDKSERFLENYVEIYDRFFIEKEGIYKNSRKRSTETEFKKEKPVNEKRVFIIGESVAQGLDEILLENKFKTIYPKYSWDVINAANGGYDSYRTYLVMREIVKYKPDIVVVMLGNNEGIHNPAKINQFIYRTKIKFLKKSWITRIITDRLFKTVKLDKKHTNSFFEKNLKKIAFICERNKIPVLFSILPVNQNIPRIFQEPDSRYDKKNIEAWLLSQFSNERFLRKFSSSGDPAFQVYIGKALKKSGLSKDGQNNYRRKGIPDQERMNRNEIIKKTSESFSYVIVNDLAKSMEEIIKTSDDFEVFCDEVHFWPPVYDLITGLIVNESFNYRKTLFKNYETDSKLKKFAINEDINKEIIRTNKSYINNWEKKKDKLISIHNQFILNKYWIDMNSALLSYMHGNNSDIVEQLLNDYSLIPLYKDKAFYSLNISLAELYRKEKKYLKALERIKLIENRGISDGFSELLKAVIYIEKNKTEKARKTIEELVNTYNKYNWIDFNEISKLINKE